MSWHRLPWQPAYANCICRFRLLLPMSKAAKRYFLSCMPEAYPPPIEPKTHVFTGGIAVPASAVHARERYLTNRSAGFRLGFVARSFWGKSGPATL